MLDDLEFDPSAEDDEITYEVCPSCLVAGVIKKCKVCCPTCGMILLNCNGD